MTFVESPVGRRPVSTGVAMRVAAVSALIVAGLTGTAFAQAEDAEAAIRQGMELRKQGQDARALPWLEKAYKLSRTPRTAAQLGLVQMGLGYWLESERHLDEALGDPDNYWVAKHRIVLDGARSRVRGMIGQVTIAGEPKGAEVFVNGRSVGRLPLAQPVRLGKGPVEIELRAEGYVSSARSLTVAGGADEHLAFTLLRMSLSAEPTAPVLPAAVPPAAVADGEPRPQLTVGGGAKSAPPAADSPVLRGLAWGSAALAVTVLAFGGIETMVMRGKRDDFNERTVASPTAQDPNHRSPECTTTSPTTGCALLQDAYSRARTLAIVGYVSGGIFALGSTVLFVLTSQGHDANPQSPRSSAFVSPILGGCFTTLTSVGVACGMRF